MPDTPVKWGTIAIICGIITPLIMAAVGWGVLYERVDDLARKVERYDSSYSNIQSAINTLNINMATLSQTVQGLSRDLQDRRRDMHP